MNHMHSKLNVVISRIHYICKPILASTASTASVLYQKPAMSSQPYSNSNGTATKVSKLV